MGRMLKKLCVIACGCYDIRFWGQHNSVFCILSDIVKTFTVPSFDLWYNESTGQKGLQLFYVTTFTKTVVVLLYPQGCSIGKAIHLFHISAWHWNSWWQTTCKLFIILSSISTAWEVFVFNITSGFPINLRFLHCLNKTLCLWYLYYYENICFKEKLNFCTETLSPLFQFRHSFEDISLN